MSEFGIYVIHGDYANEIIENEIKQMQASLQQDAEAMEMLAEAERVEATLIAEYDSCKGKDRTKARRRNESARKAKQKRAEQTRRSKTKAARKFQDADLNPRKADKQTIMYNADMKNGHIWATYEGLTPCQRKAKEHEQAMRQDWDENELVYKYDEPTPVDDEPNILAAIKDRITLKQLLYCKEDWLQNIKVSRYDSDEVLFAGKIQNLYTDDKGNDMEEQNKGLLDMIVVYHDINFDAHKVKVDENGDIILNLFDIYYDVRVCTKAEYEEDLQSLGEE